ncbi:imidazole glycerol phosphate synthase subunit HisH [Flavobacterium sp. MC2016-06]|jgi:glutamine amidotransferase|uniref:imidazole glycerol phosphate synthase subunit HisH n=1 Tax=Flavobacterium sp. MC2016-06 TaxID=2676308 RepID=UPI0012BA90F3|nr:imidazole glycerol phosphate synthase subunit HisH [Flavobacterium sp. MC2016-06]MBU3858636.1 imidazole glycerol phosphate synthase subunit HisH [Flavobacterium sp. MC2016-06]
MGDIKKNVIIIDYQLGNLFSVKQACDTIGINAKISSDKDDVLNADALILPGVGAFIEAMNNLKKFELDTAIQQKVKSGTPIFGICLGQQLLFTESEEFGAGKGLDLISGVIKRFPETLEERMIKVPHIAWNTIYKSQQDWNQSALSELDNNDFMYFIHSYYVKPADDSCILTKTNYDGIEFCSSILRDNIFATQFHPEKSATKGISIYKNWALINNLL